ncbi:hypothetical protein SAMN05444411_1167 [Lutibacter oricola]|uniref:Uncharacterized protein n=1 Tax=Lutibacter oricola TaxID=762486 RepID=A0A1H3GSI3_9FLAO|nr:hypothetical protein [Lutibacter oricola]SDY05608.1 hypothetical protein SAMN05444411_1167 [Lutibacter oricola]
MEIERVTLRKEPKLEIILKKNNFEIISNNKNDCGIYFFKFTDSMRIEKRKINWGVTLLSYVFEFLYLDLIGDEYWKKRKLKFKYNDIEKEINLEKCDKTKIKLVIEKIKLLSS